MKKLIAIIGISAFLFCSCSSDSDSNSNSSTSVLLQKDITSLPDGSVITTNYTYNGDRIVQAIQTGTGNLTNAFTTYTGDLITKMDYKLPDGTLTKVVTFQYNSSNQLTTFIRSELNTDQGLKQNYVYNSNGTITSTSFTGNATTQTTAGPVEVYTMVNGEVTSIDEGSNYRHFTYDVKNNPFQNVTGYQKVAFCEDPSGTLHNITNQTVHNSFPVNTVVDYQYTYTSASYPATVSVNVLGSNYSQQFFY